MLHALSIRNILLIETLDLDFQPGLNVLTGETGAGKSILLDSLGFVLGWRGRSDIVRQGATQGEVTAEFSLVDGHPAHSVLSDAGYSAEDGLILRRTNSPDGRKRAYINDKVCSGELLRALSETLVEIHGQNDDKGLLDVKGHRMHLDNFAGVTDDVAAVRAAWRALASARKTLVQAESKLEEASRDAEFLRHSVAELDELSPEVGEDEVLDTQRRLMQAAARIREGISKALSAVSTGGAEGAMSDAIRWLEDAAPQAGGHLEEPVEALGRALSEVADAQRGIEEALSALDFNPSELEHLEERLFAIRALARKHNVLPDDLAQTTEDFRVRLVEIDTGAGHILELQEAMAKAEHSYSTLADDLSQSRRAAGVRLDMAMMAELTPLKMERAEFTTEVTAADQAGLDGKDRVVFKVATNPGAPSGPINKIASGGELSRFLLALKVCLTSRVSGLTMIFDEIDRGVGGATADAVGRRLANLADGGQVLVVTHSPQVAALGSHHWRVSKSDDGQNTLTDVRPLDAEARIDEIARMLAGDIVTAEARSAAEVLLEG
ncbi:DNA repair protein RecN [Rhodobacterales bacterium 52_120_T64]|nr:DNA repair protein RecN [Rhodobacterales bacterium 52_120_T64]